MEELKCFLSYDVRGVIGDEFNHEIAYRIGRATAQHLKAKKILVGYDMRETSPQFSQAVISGILDAGSNAFSLGLSGTEEMYSGVVSFSACAGIVVTASHNPQNYNGLKIVKSGSQVLDKRKDFDRIKRLAELNNWDLVAEKGKAEDIALPARELYIDRILGFITCSNLNKLRVLVNCGNGAVGPVLAKTVKKMEDKGSRVEFLLINEEPMANPKYGMPNPLIECNQRQTSDAVQKFNADIGIAFDGDFDRCIFFDDQGRFISNNFIVGLIAEILLLKEPYGKIIHDHRAYWNIEEVAKEMNAGTIVSKVGHTYFKEAMRKNSALYGGELSGHHYFRDFSFCDSGLIPLLLVVEHLCKSHISLSRALEKYTSRYATSNEINFNVTDADRCIQKVKDFYSERAQKIDLIDGLSINFPDWRFNLRKSSTEQVLRLNLEFKADFKHSSRIIKNITDLIS